MNLKPSINLKGDGRWLADLLYALTDMDRQPESPAFKKLKKAAEAFTQECLGLEREADRKEWYLKNWIAWYSLPDSNRRKEGLVDGITRGLPDPIKARDFVLSPILKEARLEQLQKGDPPHDLFEGYVLSCEKGTQNTIRGREEKGIVERYASRLSILLDEKTSTSDIRRKAKHTGFRLFLKTDGKPSAAPRVDGDTSPRYDAHPVNHVWSMLRYILPTADADLGAQPLPDALKSDYVGDTMVERWANNALDNAIGKFCRGYNADPRILDVYRDFERRRAIADCEHFARTVRPLDDEEAEILESLRYGRPSPATAITRRERAHTFRASSMPWKRLQLVR